MLYREYDNFDNLFHDITHELVYNPDLFTFCTSMDGFVEDLILKSNSIDCSLELNKFGYKIGKWKHLLTRYLNYDNWIKFKENIPTIKGNTYTFYFNQHDKHNGPCLIAMVFMRKVKKDKWSSVKVLYRVTELQRRFSADLVFINRLLTDINNSVECVDVNSVEFILPYGYVSTMFINGYLNYFDIDIEELNKSHYFVENLIKKHNKYFLPDCEVYTKYVSIARLQKLLSGEVKYPKINIENLKLDGSYDIIKSLDNQTEENIVNKINLW